MAITKINKSQINDVYSTSEQDTGKVWIDGRPIYRIVVQATTNATTAGQVMNVTHGISGLTNSMLIISGITCFKIGQSATSSNVTQLTYFEGTSTPANQVALTGVDSTYISLKFGYGGWGNTFSSTILEYVK